MNLQFFPFLLKLIKIYIEVYLVSQYYELGVGPDSLNDISRPVPFHDFTLFVILSLSSRVVLQTHDKNILLSLGEPAVNRERTTNYTKS